MDTDAPPAENGENTAPGDPNGEKPMETDAAAPASGEEEEG